MKGGQVHVKKQVWCSMVGVAAVVAVWASVGLAAHDDQHGSQELPAIFQAAGPNAASIQSMVDQFRAAFGGANNGNGGPQAGGRREINWDGGGSSATSVGATPFEVFLITRGARITTPGTGFVQAPPSGLATQFGNPTYADIFKPFSQLRLFSPIDSNVTKVQFFLPGGGDIPATVSGFGAVFADVDRQSDDDDDHGGHHGHEGRRSPTTIEYYDADGKLIHTAVVPAAPGDGTLSFFGAIFKDATIARVRITTGNVAPGPDDTKKRDVVMMDDFIYGEPKFIQ
jgi:hypothetical protein